MEAVLALKAVFGGQSDGYIAPTMNTPYHIDNNYRIPAELVVYDPLKEGLRHVGDATRNVGRSLDIGMCLYSQGGLEHRWFPLEADESVGAWTMKGGGVHSVMQNADAVMYSRSKRNITKVQKAQEKAFAFMRELVDVSLPRPTVAPRVNTSRWTRKK